MPLVIGLVTPYKKFMHPKFQNPWVMLPHLHFGHYTHKCSTTPGGHSIGRFLCWQAVLGPLGWSWCATRAALSSLPIHWGSFGPGENQWSSYKLWDCQLSWVAGATQAFLLAGKLTYHTYTEFYTHNIQLRVWPPYISYFLNQLFSRGSRSCNPRKQPLSSPNGLPPMRHWMPIARQ